MTPDEYKGGMEIIQSLEPEVYTNAELLETYDFKRKIFPLKVEHNPIDIGTERQESASYESFGESKSVYTYITHQICLKPALDYSFDKDQYPNYFISISEREAEALKTNFANTQN